MKGILQFFRDGSKDQGRSGDAREAYCEGERIASSEFGEIVAAVPDEGVEVHVWLDHCASAIDGAWSRFAEGDEKDHCTPFEYHQIKRMMAAYIIRQTELARQLWPTLAPGEPYPDWE